MDVSQYLEIFLDETSEHLQSLSDQLMILENEPENEDTINEIFRAAHSLKGMAGTMGYKRMQTLTHDMENVFSEVRNGKMKVSSHLIDVLFQALDALEEYKNTIQETQDEGTNDNEAIIKELQQILDEGTGAAPAAEKSEEAPAAAEPEAEKAEETFKTAFQKKVAPDATPILKVDSSQQNVGLAIVDALMSTGKYQSKSEIKRLMKQGAIKINGEKVTDIALITKIEKDAVIQVGKGTFYKLH